MLMGSIMCTSEFAPLNVPSSSDVAWFFGNEIKPRINLFPKRKET